MGTQRRTAFLDHCAAWSGGEIALLRLLEPLADTQPLVVLGEDGPLATELSRRGIEVRVLSMRLGTNRLSRAESNRPPLSAVLDVWRYATQLCALFEHESIGLVHTNSLKSGIYGCLAARRARVPVVWHVRDRIAPDYLPAALVRLLRLLLLVLPDVILTNSRATESTLGPIVRRVVPHHVLDDPFRNAQPAAARTGPRSPDEAVVALVGRLSPWKGQHLFLDALEILPTVGERTVTGVVYGSALFGEEDYAVTVADRLRHSPLADRVHLTTFEGDVSQVLAEVDVLVSASVIPEPFGQVVVEAIANGVPVAVPDVGGPSEIVTDERDGLTYAAGDASDLAEKLRCILADEGLYARLSGAGLERARSYDPGVVSARFVQLVDRVERLPWWRRLRTLLTGPRIT